MSLVSLTNSAVPSLLACFFCVIMSIVEGEELILPNSDSLCSFYFLLCIYAAPKMPVNVSLQPLILICSAMQSSPQGDLKNLVELLICFIYHHDMQDPVTMIE